ncbi:MAG: Hsp20/alpha crystallin family protein [Ilumatobacteraceae bacterium]
MSVLRKSYIDLDWPAWMSSRLPLDRFDGWTDVASEVGIRVEEFEKNDQFVIRAEVPGIDPDKDVELALSEGVLRLMVHRQKEKTTSDARHYRSEFHYGSFTRLIALPAGASDSDVKATYHNGILEVHVPMNGHHAHEKRIAIETRS